MALKHSLGNVGGSFDAPSMTVAVWDSAFADVSEGDAVERATLAAPDEILGVPQGINPGVNQVAGHIYLITVNYEAYDSKPPDPPPAGEFSVDYRMNFQAQPKYVYSALACIGIYDTDGLVSGRTRRKVNVQKVGGINRVVGMQIDPLPESHTLDVVIPNADVDSAYRKTVSRLQGRFNDGPFMGYQAGEVQLVRFNASKRNADDWNFSYGFGAQEEQTNVIFDGVDSSDAYDTITVPSMFPHSIAWSVDMDVLDAGTGITEKLAEFVVVQRVWELDDFDDLGLGL